MPTHKAFQRIRQSRTFPSMRAHSLLGSPIEMHCRTNGEPKRSVGNRPCFQTERIRPYLAGAFPELPIVHPSTRRVRALSVSEPNLVSLTDQSKASGTAEPRNRSPTDLIAANNERTQ